MVEVTCRVYFRASRGHEATPPTQSAQWVVSRSVVVTGKYHASLMARLRLFAQAREAAGTSEVTCAGSTVAEVLDAAVAQFGHGFADVLAMSKVWVNGEEVPPTHAVGDNDEVAVLPPVSGGA